jgi:PPOX class probable F420-dependent enzyme
MDLFEKRAFAHLDTLLPDRTPHVTPVWVDYDGEHLLVNTPQGNRKDRNKQERPHIALSIQDPENPYRYLAVRGRVVASTDEGAREHIEKLAQRYTGAKYQGPPGPRHLHKIAPERVFGLSRSRRI